MTIHYGMEPKETTCPVLGKCEGCGEPIYPYEEYYDIEGELVHWDCLREWADKYKTW